MLAFVAAVGIFACCWAIGLAALSLVRLTSAPLAVALAAPALGSGVAVLPLFFMSNLGVPMRFGGPPTLIVLVIAATAVLIWRRPVLPRGVGPVVAAALASLLLVGHPMWRFGFNWLAN